MPTSSRPVPSVEAGSPWGGRGTARGRETFLAVLGPSPLPALLLDADAASLWVLVANEAARRLLSPADPLGGDGLAGVLAPDDLLALTEAAADVLGGRAASWQRPVVVAGSGSPVDLTLTRLVTPGEPALVVAHLLERPAPTAPPRPTEVHVDSPGRPRIWTDLRGTVLHVSSAVERLSGHAARDLVGRPVWESLVGPDRRAELQARFSPFDVDDNRGLGDALDSWVSREGTTRALTWRHTVLNPTASDPVVMLTGTDLTEHRVAQSLFDRVLQGVAGTAIVATDAAGTITFVSHGAEELLGHSAADLVGRATPLVFLDPAEVRAHAHTCEEGAGIEPLVHAVDRGEAFSRQEWTCVRADGERRAVTLTISALLAADSSPEGYLLVGEDVTEQRRLDDLLHRARRAEAEAMRRLEHLERAKDDFLTTVGHELRTPLASILGFTELLQEAEGTPSADLLERIRRNGERMLELVEGMATLARVGSTPVTVDAPEVDLSDVVRRAVAHATCPAGARHQHLEVELPDLPVLVRGHEEDLVRAVGELLDNGVKFTPDGGSITVSLTRGSDHCLLLVADTGHGIPAHEHDHVFDRFARSAATIEQAVPGTGLGLAILQAVVTTHGGSVAMSSQAGGTRFTVRLPLR